MNYNKLQILILCRFCNPEGIQGLGVHEETIKNTYIAVLKEHFNLFNMKIKKITLNGYKRFHSLTIDLGEKPKRIIALVGPNGCGKSSVLDGMLFCKNYYRMIGNTGKKDYHYHSINKEPNYKTDNIKIEFEQGDFFNVMQEKIKTGKDNTIFSFRSSYRYNSNLNVQQLQATEEIRLNNYGATTSSDIDQKMEQNYMRLNVKYNEYLNDSDCKPSEAKAKIIGDLNSSIENCLDLKIVNIGDIQAGKGTLFFSKTDQPTEFQFNVLSSGEKEVVDMLLDLYIRQEDYDDSVFLIDEPELHINTSIQRKLMLEINKLIGDKCQIWITTHSIGFLRALQDELKDNCQIIEFESGVEWASEEKTLTPIIKNSAKWKSIFSTALDDLTGLICPRTIVYCEGKDKPAKDGSERGFDAKVYNQIFNEKYPDVLFVSSGGNTELDKRSNIALAILNKVFSDLDILVFKDRDMSSGKLNNEEDRKLYLENNPYSHRVMKRWEVENYLFDKEVLTKYCSDKSLSFDEHNYNEFVSDITNQNIKDKTNYIKNFCNITTSINPETFKINLSKYITPDMQVYKELEECIFERK